MNSPLLEPIAVIAYGLMFVCWVTYQSKIKLYIYASFITLSCYILITSPLLANSLLAILENDLQSEVCADNSAKVIVVLGGGSRGIARSKTEFERLHIDSYRRAIGATKLAKIYIDLPVIISGGGDGNITVASIMSELMINHGISESRITIEDKSISTSENGIKVAALLNQLKINSIYLVTSAVHMQRASKVFLKEKLIVCNFSVDRQRVRNLEWTNALIPQISSLRKTTDAFHEIMGLIWYFINNKI